MPEIEPEDVRAEAKRWIDLADDMSKIHSKTGDLWLGVTAFMVGVIGDVTPYPAYSGFHDLMITRIGGGATEFEHIGQALKRLADEYEETDELSREAIDRAYTVRG